MRALAQAFFRKHGDLSLAVLALRDNAAGLDLSPWDIPVEVLEPSENRELVEQYLRLNHHAFRTLPLPRWVLSDLYLMPGVIGLVLGPASRLEPEARAVARAGEGRAILAAYVGAPSVVPGRFVGVSLIGFSSGLGAGAWAKVLTLKMVRATSLRGVTQWDTGSLKVHTRMGPLRVVGPAPGGHELGGQSFAYECDLTDESVLAAAMQRSLPPQPSVAVPSEDVETLGRIAEAAARGERHLILPPGLDGQGRVIFGANTAALLAPANAVDDEPGTFAG